MISSIIWFIIIFSIVVISHEFGHYLLARANGIRVKEFLVGFGPVIFKFKKGETVFKVCLLPLGGACVYDGMDEIDKDAEAEEDSERIIDRSKFPNARPWAKIATLVAGPLFNFVLGFIVAFIMVNMIVIREPVVTEVIEGGAAEAAGIMPGDRITAIDGEKIYLYDEISVYTTLYRGGDTHLTVDRNGEELEIVMTPYYSEQYGKYMIGIINDTFVEELKGGDAFKYTWYEMRYNVIMVWKSLGALLTGHLARENVAGPVGVVNMVGDIIEETSPYGWQTVLVNMLNLMLLLTVNLGIFNMLPVPALDGGRLVFILFELVTGKRIPSEKEGLVHFIGLLLLLGLILLITVHDIRGLL